MDIALAMKYGGEPISADECDETSYLTMGLICPCLECQDLVRWVAPKIRVSPKGKEYHVKSHFSHFKALDPVLQERCDRRVGGLKKTDLDKISKKAAQQRYAYFQSWFWTVISHHIIRVDIGHDPTDILFLRGEYSDMVVSKEYEDALILNYKKTFQPMMEKEAIEFLNACSQFSSYRQRYGLPDPSLPEEKDTIVGMFYKFELLAKHRMHRQIVKEAIAFLGAKRNYSLRRALIIYLGVCNLDHIRDIFYKAKNIHDLGFAIYNIIAKMMAVVPWADEFDDLANNKPLSTLSHSGSCLLYAINEIYKEHNE